LLSFICVCIDYTISQLHYNLKCFSVCMANLPRQIFFLSLLLQVSLLSLVSHGFALPQMESSKMLKENYFAWRLSVPFPAKERQFKFLTWMRMGWKSLIPTSRKSKSKCIAVMFQRVIFLFTQILTVFLLKFTEMTNFYRKLYPNLNLCILGQFYHHFCQVREQFTCEINQHGSIHITGLFFPSIFFNNLFQLLVEKAILLCTKHWQTWIEVQFILRLWGHSCNFEWKLRSLAPYQCFGEYFLVQRWQFQSVSVFLYIFQHVHVLMHTHSNPYSVGQKTECFHV